MGFAIDHQTAAGVKILILPDFGVVPFVPAQLCFDSGNKLER